MPNDIRRVFQRLARVFHLRQRDPDPLSPVPSARKVVRPPPVVYARLIDHKRISTSSFKARDMRVSREGLRPEIVDFERAFRKELHSRGLPFIVHNGLRTFAEQAALLKRGVTRAGPGESPHNFGAAVDVIHDLRLWDLTKEEWAFIGLIGKEVARRRNIKIVWGGDFRSIYDPAHWELKDWRLPR